MLVVVGGHSRNIGKTSVVAGLIAALPELRWTAMKITQFGHGVCSSAGEPCECGTGLDHPYAITEEHDPRTGADSARFLAAGAQRSFWIRTAAGELGHAMPALRGLLATSENAIAESNSLLQFLRPDVYLVVMDPAVDDFKDSSLRFLDRADAVIEIERTSAAEWSRVSPKLWRGKPRFTVTPPQYVTPAIADFVRERLSMAR